MSSDPIADMITQLRNASMAGKKMVSIPRSTIKERLAEILKKEGFVEDVKVEKNVIRIYLQYFDERSALLGLKRISRPGVRRYAKTGKLPRALGDSGIAIISTPQGLMTARQAKEKKLGGEILCEIW